MKTRKNLNVWPAISMFLLLMVSTAAGGTIYVDADAAGANNGSSWTASDICDASPKVSLVSITTNEADEAKGDGHTADDIQVDDNGLIYLRAERSGTGSGRIYTITYQAVDDSGNAAVARATVTVPHDQR